MHSSALYAPLKILSAVVIALMLAAIAYAAWIAVRYWSGIGV